MLNIGKLGALTNDEIKAFKQLARAANTILRLPELHLMEREEVCHDIHKIQNRILARPGLRKLGWKAKKSFRDFKHIGKGKKGN